MTVPVIALKLQHTREAVEDKNLLNAFVICQSDRRSGHSAIGIEANSLL